MPEVQVLRDKSAYDLPMSIRLSQDTIQNPTHLIDREISLALHQPLMSRIRLNRQSHDPQIPIMHREPLV